MTTNKSAIKVGSPEIIPYRGYASAEKFYLKGRVVLTKDIVRGHSYGRWRNIMDTFRRFRSTELPDCVVKLLVDQNSFITQTDREGYFTFDEAINLPLEFKNQIWQPVELMLSYPKEIDIFKTTSEIFLPSAQANYGIISDIDDTVLKSYMGSWLKLRMLYATFVKDGFQRKPMEGMVGLLNKMVNSAVGEYQNPIFYVSNSPWNLYDMIEEFIDFHTIPTGPILLRDFGVNPIESFSGHKMATITRIFDTYPSLSFVLLGDSASKDADHYLKLATLYPGRVKAIYIRFTDNTRNARRVVRLIQEQKEVHAKIIRTSHEISKDAENIGLI